MTAISSLLLLRQIGAVALLVERDRFAALLDHALQHPQDLGIGDAVGVALAARRDVAVLEAARISRTVDKRAGVLRAHRRFQPVGEGSRNIGIPPDARGHRAYPVSSARGNFAATYA